MESPVAWVLETLGYSRPCLYFSHNNEALIPRQAKQVMLGLIDQKANQIKNKSNKNIS